MIIGFDPAKRERNLAKHGLDLADAAKLLAGRCLERLDDRWDYGEDRWVSVGWLEGQLAVCVWSDWGEQARVISLRKATADEQAEYFREIGG
ncbi:MAG TPA: BrnT family toxin [Allosphingosinicella sp.]|nr:BrnT family toxin [Allosphingosinicella sp.]